MEQEKTPPDTVLLRFKDAKPMKGYTSKEIAHQGRMLPRGKFAVIQIRDSQPETAYIQYVREYTPRGQPIYGRFKIPSEKLPQSFEGIAQFEEGKEAI